MKKIHLVKTLNALKSNLAKNSVTPEGQALIDEITAILADMANDPDVEYNEADILAKVTEAATKAGAAAAAEVASAFEGKHKTENKLDIAKAREIFENALKNSAGKGRGAFAKNLKSGMVENGITGLPSMTEIFPELQTKFENNSILSKLRKLGNYALTIPISVQGDDETDVRAQGHTIGETKVDQNLVFTPKTFSLGTIYKKISLPKIMSYQAQMGSAALSTWLVTELVERIEAEIIRVILIGDGRASNSKFKVTTLETIGTKTAADDYTVYVNKSNALPTLEDVRAMVDSMDDSKPISLYIHPVLKTALAKTIFATGGSVSYIADSVLAEQLGVAEIIKFKKLAYAVPGTASTVPAVIAIQHDSYGWVGSDLQDVAYENWDVNEDRLLAEIFIGGGIIKPLSTGLITITKPA